MQLVTPLSNHQVVFSVPRDRTPPSFMLSLRKCVQGDLEPIFRYQKSGRQFDTAISTWAELRKMPEVNAAGYGAEIKRHAESIKWDIPDSLEAAAFICEHAQIYGDKLPPNLVCGIRPPTFDGDPEKILILHRFSSSGASHFCFFEIPSSNIRPENFGVLLVQEFS